MMRNLAPYLRFRFFLGAVGRTSSRIHQRSRSATSAAPAAPSGHARGPLCRRVSAIRSGSNCSRLQRGGGCGAPLSGNRLRLRELKGKAFS